MLDEAEQAKPYLLEAIRIARAIHGYLSALFALSAFAMWLCGQGGSETAVELIALTLQSPVLANSAWYNELFIDLVNRCVARFAPEAVTAARARGAQRQLWPTLDEVAVIVGGE